LPVPTPFGSGWKRGWPLVPDRADDVASRVAGDESMIRKSGNRFSDEIMLR
jgi:hypothetical protein